jgi:hypothetical protein
MVVAVAHEQRRRLLADTDQTHQTTGRLKIGCQMESNQSKVVVSLRDVVGEMTLLNYENRAYLNKRTGELIILSDDELSQAEEDIDMSDSPEWMQEMMRQAKEVIGSDDYIPLPTAFEINDYHIMEDFCYTVEDDKIRDKLLNAISGRGAFRRFKDAIHFLDIQDDWYRFQNEELEKIAIEWLEEKGIAYTRDAKPV